ncbi:hypothetical protein [Bradyrhizobium cajani]|uniref:Uncharacterized protein n=1 Tax=Bradyrhizobium cajani TaxID=1928661 RepID=A0A844TQJ8_9BRAD|nr:hypothetical protein [Bradyrhizobium cajani]MCP3372548.1 hypothetical protein [Bradyrhizobium cajani]MVT76810.1 hypothetical protein [Bradyrhizobium cajani]
MRVGAAAFVQSELIALQILSSSSGGARSETSAGSSRAASASDGFAASGATGGASALLTYSASGALPDGGNAIAAIKAMAKSSIFQNAAQGHADDQVRALVRDGKLAELPALDEAQYASLSKSEQNIYGVVRTLQGLYDAMPKTIEQALSDRVKFVIDTYPESIARMQDQLSTVSPAEAELIKKNIVGYQDELKAAQEGRMQIHAVKDSSLVTATEEFSASGGEFGWSGRGVSVHADIPALQNAYGTKNVLPGDSPYFGTYVITW